MEKPRTFNCVVFNAQQIDGLADQHRDLTLMDQPSERIRSIVRGSHAGIAYDANSGPARYDRDSDTILLKRMDEHDDSGEQQISIIHQLAHWTAPRLGRDIDHPVGSIGAAREELRTNLASLMLGDRLLIGWNPGDHAMYVESWAKMLRGDATEILRAALSAEAITQHVLGLERARTAELSQEQMQELSRKIAAQQPVEERQRDTVEIKAPTMIEADHPSLSTSDDRTYLAVPYDEKDDARALGAQWDRKARAWFVPAGQDLAPFEG